MTHPIRVGIGGWTYEPWRGVFYPDRLSQKKELEYASSKLTSIETLLHGPTRSQPAIPDVDYE